MEREAELDLDAIERRLAAIVPYHREHAGYGGVSAEFHARAQTTIGDALALIARVRKAEVRAERLVALATKLGASEGQLARAHGDRLEVRRIQDEDALFAELIAVKDRAEKAEAQLAESRAATEPIVCEYCGEPATMEIMISVAGRDSRWLPRCYDHYREAEEDTREVYEHEMSHFGGAYGAPVMESRPIAGAILALQGEIAEWKARAEKAEAERGALQRHYDAAAPEHNLLALLDLYHERMVTAEAERDKARDLVHASMAQAVTCNEQARDRDSWKARALAAEPVAQAFADVRAFDCDEVSRILYHDVVCTAHTARMRAALERLAKVLREREAGRCDACEGSGRDDEDEPLTALCESCLGTGEREAGER